MTTLPARVIITESSSRDGLQSLGADIATGEKVALIEGLAGAGLTSFDAVSFVDPRAVPQMADGAQVVADLRGRDDLELWGLVPNLRGLQSALDAGVTRIGLLTAASETFTIKNTNATVKESLSRIEAIMADKPSEVQCRGYVSTATHCPYEGPQDPAVVADLAARLVDLGVDRVFLGETLGMATPSDVERLLDAVLASVAVEKVGVHFHDTYGQAVANTVVAVEAGISQMDSSAGGLGGCPYAPGAAGNVATEDLGWLLGGLGIEHGLDLATVAAVASAFCDAHGLVYNSKAGRALLAGTSP